MRHFTSIFLDEAKSLQLDRQNSWNTVKEGVSLRLSRGTAGITCVRVVAVHHLNASEVPEGRTQTLDIIDIQLQIFYGLEADARRLTRCTSDT